MPVRTKRVATSRFPYLRCSLASYPFETALLSRLPSHLAFFCLFTPSMVTGTSEAVSLPSPLELSVVDSSCG